MSKLKFTDGVEFDTAGDYHMSHRKDGWYVVGRGMLCPVKDYEDGQKVIAEMRSIDRLKSKV